MVQKSGNEGGWGQGRAGGWDRFMHEVRGKVEK